MSSSSRLTLAVVVVFALVVATFVGSVAAQKPGDAPSLLAQTGVGTAFTYQGRLTDADEPANGTFGFQFTLHEGAAGGSGLATLSLGSVTVRGGLEARVARAVFPDLVAAGCVEKHHGDRWFGVWSSGCFWPMMMADEAGA